MGKTALGNYIRNLDFNTIPMNFDTFAEYPARQMERIEDNFHQSITFDELKDMYDAFKQKICVPNFPVENSPGFRAAEQAVKSIIKLTRKLLKEQPELITAVCEIIFAILIALVKSEPGSSHCDMMHKLMNNKLPTIKEYAQTLGEAEMSEMVNAASKVVFHNHDLPNDYYYGKFKPKQQRDNLEKVFRMFTKTQYKLVQREYVEVIYSYASQIPGLPNENAEYVFSLVRNMTETCEKENPYLNLKDQALTKKHFSLVQSLLLSENFAKDSYPEKAATHLSRCILAAAVQDGLVVDVFDHFMDVVNSVIKCDKARKGADSWFNVVRIYLFLEMKEKTTQKIPLLKLFKSCLNMVYQAVITPDVPHDGISMYKLATDVILRKCKPLPIEDVKQILKIVKITLGKGSKPMAEESKRILVDLKKTKVLDWKKHVDEAKDIIAMLGKMTEEQFVLGKELSNTMWEYERFVGDFMDMLKKDKILPQLQSTLVTFFFDSILIQVPRKSEFARRVSGRDYMDFSVETKLRARVLKGCRELLENQDLPWETDRDIATAVSHILERVINSYNDDGTKVTAEENKLFMSIFKYVSDEGDSVEAHFYSEEDFEKGNVNLDIWRGPLSKYTSLHQKTATLAVMKPIMPNILRWARIAVDENHDDLMRYTFSVLQTIGYQPPGEFKEYLPDLLDLIFLSEKCKELSRFVTHLYAHNPSAVHTRFPDIFDSLESDSNSMTWLLLVVAELHPEVFTKPFIERLFSRISKADVQEQNSILTILKCIVYKYPKRLEPFFPQLCDDHLFASKLLISKMGIIQAVGNSEERIGHKAIDYLMKYIDSSDSTTALVAVGKIHPMLRKYKDYIQKHKKKLQHVEKTHKNVQVTDIIHDIIMVLEGKSLENIAEDVQQQKEDIAELDTKVDATIDTVTSIGDTVVRHDKEIGELESGLDKIEERVDDVEDDMVETKIKVEEIDNKTMTNAPKWSRDLTKLMNPTVENDWRLLASRLGYSNDDIRGWATQHDPCMALLSEWYATHKTSEASFGVLNALTEMNRTDGAAIVENAMKAAEGVVEDEEFEYPSPPPVFISYQWGVQNEVKLLKQHLNMAGYECWLDIGQMGGGDKLFAKIDNGIRGAKVVICCVTEKYAKSPNCNREVGLSVNLNKPIIPLLMEQTDWPPKGSMGPIFSEYLFIRFFQRGGEETGKNDQRYWPIPKFQELLMQLNFYSVPDPKMIKKVYASWWTPIAEDIVIDKNKGKGPKSSQTTKQTSSTVAKKETTPLVFLSYQWGKQPQIKALYQRLTSMGYSVWMDIHQMGGGDSLYDKIDRGMRGCKAVVSCMTQKYSLSANCRREVSLADALKKPIIPIMLEQIKWPPDGPMSMVFTELLYINFYRDEAVQMTWKGDQFDELVAKLNGFLPAVAQRNGPGDRSKTPAIKESSKTQNTGSVDKTNATRNVRDTSKDSQTPLNSNNASKIPDNKRESRPLSSKDLNTNKREEEAGRATPKAPNLMSNKGLNTALMGNVVSNTNDTNIADKKESNAKKYAAGPNTKGNANDSLVKQSSQEINNTVTVQNQAISTLKKDTTSANKEDISANQTPTRHAAQTRKPKMSHAIHGNENTNNVVITKGVDVFATNNNKYNNSVSNSVNSTHKDSYSPQGSQQSNSSSRDRVNLGNKNGAINNANDNESLPTVTNKQQTAVRNSYADFSNVKHSEIKVAEAKRVTTADINRQQERTRGQRDGEDKKTESKSCILL